VVLEAVVVMYIVDLVVTVMTLLLVHLKEMMVETEVLTGVGVEYQIHQWVDQVEVPEVLVHQVVKDQVH
tara:strand:+ start:298 stop:504 length:207 start_codon:yes stop_codon:yes gene_type:complete